MDIVTEYKNIIYANFGKYIDEQPIEEVASMLYQADMEMTAGMFISMAIVTAVLAAIPVLLFSLYMFGISLYTYVLVLVALLVDAPGQDAILRRG